LAVSRIGAVDRLAPPVELGEAETRVFRQTAATVTPAHFLPEDLPLLPALRLLPCCRSLERRAGEEVAALVAAGKAPTQWLGT